MTLRVALVIEGDSKGAKAALDDTSKALDDLRGKAGAAAENTGATAATLADTRDAAKGAAEQSGAAGAALEKAGGQAEIAARGIATAGTNAKVASGAMGALGGALVGLASGLVIGAVVAGLTAAADEAIRFVGAMLDDSAAIEAALGKQEKLISRIGQAYKRAASGASDYGRESAAALRFESQQNIAKLEPLFQGEAASAAGSLRGINRIEDFEVVEDLGPFTKAVGDLQTAVAQGRPDINAFRAEIAAIAGTLAEDDPFRKVAEGMLQVTDRASVLQSDLSRARDALAGLEGDTQAARTALGGLPKGFDETGDAAQRAAGSIAAFKTQLAALGEGGAPGSISAGSEDSGFASPFASGGVVDRPTLFRFGAGARQLGIMGEAGPEAILPLTGGRVGAMDARGRQGSVPLVRLAGGKLGVRATPFAAGGVIGAVSGALGGLIRDMAAGRSETDLFANAILGLSDRLVSLALNDVFKNFGGGSSQQDGFIFAPNTGGGFFSNLFAGFFADGGFIPPGRFGIVGERGPEAVFATPSGARVLPNSNLAGGAAGGRPVNVTVNVTTPDAGSFRRSEGQIAAMMNRAISRGERNL